MSENKGKKWVAAWGNAISIAQRRPENYARNLTLRYPVKMLLSGSALRIKLDNFCGTEAVTVTAVTLARSSGSSSVLQETITPVSFGGAASVTIPAGETVTSDSISFSVHKGEEIAVSLYFADFTEMRSAVLITGPLSKGFFAVGNYTEQDTLPAELSNKTNWFYFLSDIDVLTDETCHAVICYGDSITAQAWPDYLMERTLQIGDGTTSIVRKAASGTRILRQYDNITYDSYGLKGAIRFPREVQVSGADTIIIQHGINDIIHPVGTDVNPFRPWSDLPTAEEMIDGLRQYLHIAKQYGLKAYLGTLLPIEGWRTYGDFREELRCTVNEWIRTTHESDGCIDFDRAVCNPAHPSAFAESFDSGDHLHPSISAYQRMAETVPKELICGKLSI
ncbi:MAG: GDSL-type esterase/lipase family protein [Ruminococcus sp.]